MRKKSAMILAIVLVFTMAFSTVGVYAKSLSEVNKEIQSEKGKLNEGKKKENALSQEIQDLEKKIGQVENEVYALEDDIEQTEADIKTAEEELKEAEEKVAEQNENLNDRLRAMYKNGSVGFLDVILNSGSISELISNIEMVKIIYSSDQEVLAQLQTAFDEIDAKKQELETLQEEMVAQKQELLDKQTALEADKAEVAKKKEGVVQANGEIEDNIAALEAEQDSIEAAINKDMNSNSGGSGGSSYSGTYIWPVPGWRSISSDYGERICPFHGREFHTGIDIPAKSGTPVKATAAGTVITAKYDDGYGYYIIISHGGGMYSLYAHNSSLLVRKGQYVSQGQTISRVGSTGNSTGPHLHFEIRKGNSSRNTVDPLNYVKR